MARIREAVVVHRLGANRASAPAWRDISPELFGFSIIADI
jgi:hypothetical protein